jgi:hypothetical protein
MEAAAVSGADGSLPPLLPLGGILDLPPTSARGGMPRWDGDDDTDRGGGEDLFARCVQAAPLSLVRLRIQPI